MATKSDIKIEQFDTVIVGAGIAGITTAYYLNKERPDSNYVILEALDNFGGTWWSHKYPGIRSDSDLYTFGFKFKPWTGVPIATAQEILNYVGETIEENGIATHIRYHHKITEAEWDSKKNQWLVKVERSDTNEIKYFSCNFLMMCQGYYRHNEGYTPEWDGMDKYKGQIVHTEEWPEDLDYTGKKVIVIGSGATTATVVPAMAPKAAHVTMLQRSPSKPKASTNALCNFAGESAIAMPILDPSWAGFTMTLPPSALSSSSISNSQKSALVTTEKGAVGISQALNICLLRTLSIDKAEPKTFEPV